MARYVGSCIALWKPGALAPCSDCHYVPAASTVMSSTLSGSEVAEYGSQ